MFQRLTKVLCYRTMWCLRYQRILIHYLSKCFNQNNIHLSRSIYVPTFWWVWNVIIRMIWVEIGWFWGLRIRNLTKSSGGSVHLLSNKSDSQKVYFYLWSKLTRRWIDIGAWDFHWVISYLYLTTSLYFQHINLIFYMSFEFLKNEKKRFLPFSPLVSVSCRC